MRRRPAHDDAREDLRRVWGEEEALAFEGEAPFLEARLLAEHPELGAERGPSRRRGAASDSALPGGRLGDR